LHFGFELKEVGRVIIRLLDDQLIEVAEEELELADKLVAAELVPPFDDLDKDETIVFPLELVEVEDGLDELVTVELVTALRELVEDETLDEDPETAIDEPELVELVDDELIAVLPVASALILSSCNIFIRLDIAFFCWIKGVNKLRVVNES
jgi:hypothetical protein